MPVVLVVIFFAVRFPGLGRYVTIDEVFWLNKSAAFAVAISEGEWEETGLAGHPGITTAWAGALGIWQKFPAFTHKAPDTLTDFHLRNFFRQQGYNPTEILAAGRLVAVFVNTAAFGLSVVCLQKLWSRNAAAVAGALVALDPFLIAHQRLLHQDGLMASFVLLSMAAFGVYLKERKPLFALLSGAAAGLAWLTKSPTFLLAPCMLALAAIDWWPKRKQNSWRQALSGLTYFAIAAVFVFVALWPKMWVLPGQALAQIWSYATGSASGDYNGPIFFNGTVYPNGELGWGSLYFYPLAFLFRTTPLVMLGLGLAIWAALSKKKIEFERPVAFGFGLFALLFVAAMTVAAKKFDRYGLPAYGVLVPLAGACLWTGIAYVRAHWTQSKKNLALGFVALLAAVQVWFGLASFPYYLSYYNPLLGGSAGAKNTMMLGWGEGLDEAAAYLNQQSGIENKRVAAWYSNAFNMQFNGQAEDIPISLELSQTELDNLLSADYLVIYVHQWQRTTPQNLLNALASLEPEYVVISNGIEYVRVYRLTD